MSGGGRRARAGAGAGAGRPSRDRVAAPADDPARVRAAATAGDPARVRVDATAGDAAGDGAAAPADDSARDRVAATADDPARVRVNGGSRSETRRAVGAMTAALLAVSLVGCGDGRPTTTARGAPEPPAAFAPLDAPPPDAGPVPAALAEALRCDPAGGSRRTPVLLVPGTGVTPEQNFGRGWAAALARRGVPHCTLALPHQGLGDVQGAGEHVAAAIRAMSAGAGGRRISIVGHSQGGMVPRWALRFFRDTRGLVDDLIAIAPDNHGVPAGDTVAACRRRGCPPATIQQAVGSRFLAALNSRRETFAGVSYTTIRTRTDEVLTPGDAPESEATSTLRGGGDRVANLLLQDVCPRDASNHRLVGTVSNTAFVLALDALAHDGPADPARARRDACARSLLPGLDRETATAIVAGLGATSAADRAAVPIVWSEPPLRPYAVDPGPGPR